MFVRVVRFEAADPEGRGARRAQIERDVELVKAGGVPDGMPPEAAEVMRSSVQRVMALVNPSDGSEASLVFCATAEDLARADAVLNAMTPAAADGHRTDVAQYEVMLDIEM